MRQTMATTVMYRMILLYWTLVNIVIAGFTLKVEVSENLPRHLCAQNIQNAKELIRRSSMELYRLTKVQVEMVNVHLPSSWVHTDCLLNISISHIQNVKTDVYVGGRDPVFGAHPHPLQYGGCGEPGLGVYLPFDGLVQGTNVSRELVMDFTRSLINHKFGVFPTHGFGNDSRYPRTYWHGDVVLESKGCANGQILCDSDSYNADSPTKQNLLCDSRSPLEIIMERSAIKDATVAHVMPLVNLQAAAAGGDQLVSDEDKLMVDENLVGYTQPEFRFSIQKTTRYILVLENSSKMEKRWKNLHNALHRFIMELRTGDELAVLTFSNSTRTNLEPTVITEENKPGIHGRVPGRAGTDEQSCISCALTDALNLVSKAASTLTKIVLVAGGDGDDTASTRVQLSEAVTVPVYAIAFREAGVNNLVEITRRGKVFVIEDDSSAHLELFNDAFLAVKGDGEPGYQRVRKFFHNKYRVVPSQQVEGKFTVEDSLRSQLKVMSITQDIEDIEMFELMSPSGTIHRFPLVERGSVYFEFDDTVETGIWSFSIKLSTVKPSIDLSVTAYAEQSADSTTVTVTAWTNVDGAVRSPVDGPVIIYARVTDGDLPLSGALVTAQIRKPQGELFEVRLTDGGSGYPDITAGDGVYSGYLTSFGSVSGFYSLEVRVEDGTGSARIPTQSVGQMEDCCGSEYPVVSTIPTPPFTRVVMAPSFYLTQGVQYFIRKGVPRIQDIFPPSRITDLTVDEEPALNSLEVKLSWSAPGGDYDLGSASRYEIRSYTSREALTDANFSASGVPVHEAVVPRPESAGTRQTCNVTLPWPNEIFFYGIVAIDEAENVGKVSNLVQVFAREIVFASESALAENMTTVTSLPSGVLEVFEDNLMVYIIAGCITGIILIILIVILISIRISRNKVAKKPKRECIAEISSPTLIHSSSGLPGILKDSSLSVLPSKESSSSSPGSFSNEYMFKPGSTAGGMIGGGSHRDDISWAILPSYTNTGFRKSSDTLVDSGYYRAGEPVDNVSEFYRPASDYATYQNLGLKAEERGNNAGDISDNGTGTTSSTDCENSETCSDKNMPHFRDTNSAGSGGKDASRNAAGEFHSLIVTGDRWRQMDGEVAKLSVSGPLSLQGLTEYELQEKRRRRESFV